MSNGRLPLVPIALAALIALTTALTRVKVEREYQDVALIADYGEVQSLAAVAGLEVSAALARLKQAGLTSVAIEEPLVQDLVNSGDLRTSRGLASTQLTATTARGAVALRTLARKLKLDPGVAVVPITAAWSLLANSGGGLDP
ncbi:MAG: hypothetical protein HUU35_14425, partial [Armatimonadetes bacterium]|nr:hypothetical protein [Armatimonadota bacterium]